MGPSLLEAVYAESSSEPVSLRLPGVPESKMFHVCDYSTQNSSCGSVVVQISCPSCHLYPSFEEGDVKSDHGERCASSFPATHGSCLSRSCSTVIHRSRWMGRVIRNLRFVLSGEISIPIARMPYLPGNVYNEGGRLVNCIHPFCPLTSPLCLQPMSIYMLSSLPSTKHCMYSPDVSCLADCHPSQDH